MGNKSVAVLQKKYDQLKMYDYFYIKWINKNFVFCRKNGNNFFDTEEYDWEDKICRLDVIKISAKGETAIIGGTANKHTYNTPINTEMSYRLIPININNESSTKDMQHWCLYQKNGEIAYLNYNEIKGTMFWKSTNENKELPDGRVFKIMLDKYGWAISDVGENDERDEDDDSPIPEKCDCTFDVNNLCNIYTTDFEQSINLTQVPHYKYKIITEYENTVNVHYIDELNINNEFSIMFNQYVEQNKLIQIKIYYVDINNNLIKLIDTDKPMVETDMLQIHDIVCCDMILVFNIRDYTVDPIVPVTVADVPKKSYKTILELKSGARVTIRNVRTIAKTNTKSQKLNNTRTTTKRKIRYFINTQRAAQK